MGQTLSAYYRSLKGKKVFFLGAGISHRQLIPKYMDLGADVTLCDGKTEDKLADYLAPFAGRGLHTMLGPSYLDALDRADVIFRTPGIDYLDGRIQQAVRAGKEVTSEIECFFRWCPCRMIGITGSDGKTTTSSLIAAALTEAGYAVHLGGNIGRPLFPVIDTVEPEDVAVVELSSFQLISMRQSPAIAVVTNVTPNHLDHHRDMREYIDAKRNILLYQDSSGVAVLNRENDLTADMAGDVRGALRWFGRGDLPNGVKIGSEGLYAVDGGEKRVMTFDGIRLPGEHNRENIAAAYAAVESLVTDRQFARAAAAFPGVEHRIEFVKEVNGVRWYNDSIATSPTRTRAGLRSFMGRVLLIAGGSDKGLSYDAFAEDLRRHVKTAFLSGPTAEKMISAVRESGRDAPEIVRTRDMEESVGRAYEAAKAGDVVLLSPASPSFDGYANFEERGRHFKQLVNAL